MHKKSLKNSAGLFKLFLICFYISSCTFGGGFVIVSYMKRYFVDKYHWIDEEEMLDYTAIAQSSPGAIAVNASVLVGWKVRGFFGMLAAVIGTALPPLIILSLISYFYRVFAANEYVSLLLKGMRAAVAAIITDVVLSLGNNIYKNHSAFQWTVMLSAFLLNTVFSVNAVYIILAAVVTGIFRIFLAKKIGK